MAGVQMAAWFVVNSYRLCAWHCAWVCGAGFGIDRFSCGFVLFAVGRHGWVLSIETKGLGELFVRFIGRQCQSGMPSK